MKKSKSSYELAQPPKRTSSGDLKLFKNPLKCQSSFDLKGNDTKNDDNHKVVIYFSDAYNNICNKNESIDGKQGEKNPPKDFMAQLKTVLEEKSKFTNKFSDSVATSNKLKPPIPEKPSTSSNLSHKNREDEEIKEKNSHKILPSFIESIDENNVIKLKIEQNFRRASELVSLISSLPKKKGNKKLKRSELCGHDASSIHELNFSHESEFDCIDEICSEGDDDEDAMSEPGEGYFYDWLFVHEWSSRLVARKLIIL